MNASLKIKFYYGLLTLVFLTIPLPSYGLGSQSMILFAFVFLAGRYFDKAIFWSNRKKIFILTLPLLSALIGCIYTDQLPQALNTVIMLLPFALFPITVLSFSIDKCFPEYALRQFTRSVVFAGTLGLSKVLFFKVQGLGDYLFYHDFSDFLKKHTTYFSLFVVSGLLYLIHDLWISHFKRYKSNGLLIAVLLVLLYILSNRISIIALFLGLLIMSLFYIHKLRNKLLFLLALSTIGLGIYHTDNFQKRFEGSQTEAGKVSDIVFRKLHWKSVGETIAQSPLLGTGTEGSKDFLFERYKTYQLTAAYQDHYNAHNQFLETTLTYGLWGLILLLLLMGTLLVSFYKTRNVLGLVYWSVFMTFFMTESILVRQSGVMLFALIFSVLWSQTSNQEVK